MPEQITQRLRRTWQKDQLVTHLQGICRLLALFCALFVANLLLDWMFALPGVARAVLMIINFCAVGYVLHNKWWQQLNPFNPVRTALQVERQRPALQSRLTSAVQLAEGEGSGAPALVNALLNDAQSRAKKIDFSGIVTFNTITRDARRLALIGLVFTISAILFPGHYAALFQRMINPASDAKYPTRTKMQGTSGDLTVRQGDPVTVWARAGGIVPESGRLQLKTAEGERENISVVNSDDKFSHTIESPLNSLTYSFHIGDTRSRPAEITVVPPPSVVKQEITLKYPDYTNRPPQKVTGPMPDVLAGTTIVWNLTLDRPLTRADMLIKNQEPQRMSLSDGRKRASFSHTATSSFSYRYRWEGKRHGYEYSPRTRHAVRVVPDATPTVEWLGNQPAIKATTKKQFNVVFRAHDDYGLTRAAIVYQRNGREPERLPLARLSGKSDTVRTTWKLADTIDNLEPGDTITWHIEVEDNRGKQPQIGRSASFTVDILGQSEFWDYVQNVQKPVTKRLIRLHETEQKSHRTLKTLREAFEKEESDPPEENTP